MARPTIAIEVWSDLACPWCYVGKKRLDNAIDKMNSVADVKLRWHAYIIDTMTKPLGEEYMAYNKRRWGSDGWTISLRESGKKDGAIFKDWKWWANSLNAHRLVHYAGEHGKASEAKEALFVESYDKGGNISEIDVLKRIGNSLGLPGVDAFLDSDDGFEEVLKDDTIGKKQMGIGGVPFYVISSGSSKQYSLSGAQPASAFTRTFLKVLKEDEEGKPT